MRECPQCGREFPDSVKFCPADATTLRAETESSRPVHKCPKCGGVYPTSARFCPRDGAVIGTAPE